MPRCLDLRINVDHEVVIFVELEVPVGDHLHHPVGKVIADDSVGNVDDPLLAHLGQLSGNRHVPLEVMVVADLVKHILNGQALILWNREVSDGITLDVAFDAADEVL